MIHRVESLLKKNTYTHQAVFCQSSNISSPQDFYKEILCFWTLVFILLAPKLTLESLSNDKRIISFLFWTNMYLPMYNFWSENQQFSRQTLLDYDLAPCRGNLKNCSTARNERAIAIVCSARRDSLWAYTHTWWVTILYRSY